LDGAGDAGGAAGGVVSVAGGVVVGAFASPTGASEDGIINITRIMITTTATMPMMTFLFMINPPVSTIEAG
jgi:hypothetical protein